MRVAWLLSVSRRARSRRAERPRSFALARSRARRLARVFAGVASSRLPGLASGAGDGAARYLSRDGHALAARFSRRRALAALRYRLFGQLDACRIPRPEQAARFLD